MWASILATLLSMGHHLAPHIIQCQVLQPLLTCWQVGSLRTGSGHRARLGLLVTTNTWQEMACTAWAQVLVYRVCFLTREPPQHRSWSLVQCNSERRGVPHPQCALCSLPDTWRMLGCKAWPSPVWHVSCTMFMAWQICQRLHHSVCHFTWPYRQERNQAEPRQCTMWSRTGRAIYAVVKYPEVCSEWIVTLLCPVTTSLSSTASPSHTWAHLLRACYAQEHEPHSQLHIHVPGKDMHVYSGQWQRSHMGRPGTLRSYQTSPSTEGEHGPTFSSHLSSKTSIAHTVPCGLLGALTFLGWGSKITCRQSMLPVTPKM